MATKKKAPARQAPARAVYLPLSVRQHLEAARENADALANNLQRAFHAAEGAGSGLDEEVQELEFQLAELREEMRQLRLAHERAVLAARADDAVHFATRRGGAPVCPEASGGVVVSTRAAVTTCPACRATAEWAQAEQSGEARVEQSMSRDRAPRGRKGARHG